LGGTVTEGEGVGERGNLPIAGSGIREAMGRGEREREREREAEVCVMDRETVCPSRSRI